MKKGLFIILNIFSVLLEYFIIYLFFRILLHKNLIISLIMTIVILLIMALFVIYANVVLRKVSIEDKERPCEKELLELIRKVEEKYHKKFYLHYVSAPQPNPAWCIGRHIYINNEYRSDEVFLPGVIAHELGHAISGISDYIFIPSIKLSTTISRVLHLTIVAMYNAKKKWLNVSAKILFFPYYIINLNNIIFTYHFLRDDEIAANSIAVKLGYGEHLRSYYGLANYYGEDPFLRKCDFFHPSISKMISIMNKDMKLKKELLNIYSINNLLILADIKTLTFTVPSHITEIGYNAIHNDNLIKISSKYVEKVHPNAFKNNKNLKAIYLENVKEFPVSCISRLDKLEIIKINDLKILEKIYHTYPNRKFSLSIYKVLVKNGIINEDE